MYAATSWGDELGNSMSLNNNNYFIVVNSDPDQKNGDISFIAGKINPDKKPAQIEFFSESKVKKADGDLNLLFPSMTTIHLLRPI